MEWLLRTSNREGSELASRSLGKEVDASIW